MTAQETNIAESTINLFRKMGYSILSSSDVEKARGGKTDTPLLESVLKRQLLLLNPFIYDNTQPSFSNHSFEEAFLTLSYVPPREAEKIYNWLLHGKTHLKASETGSTRVIIRYIDWENVSNNAFHIVSDFEATFGNEKVRFDLALFVNGIPLVLIELKSTASDDNVLKRWESLNNKQSKNTPVSFAQLLLLISAHQVQYNTTHTGSELMHVWQAVDKGQPTDIKQALYDLCEPIQLLHYIKHFILTGNSKRIAARQHQVEAVQHTLKRINSHEPGHPQRGGIIKHPEGSGKTATLMFLVKNILLADHIRNPQFLIITDRTELENQITERFSMYGLPVASAYNRRSLFDLLDSNTPVISVVAHKFYNFDFPQVYNRSKELFIFLEEVQRGYSGVISKTLYDLFPFACYIGFTGLPILKKNPDQFYSGEVIHSLSLQQAVESNLVLSVIYEKRSARFAFREPEEEEEIEYKKTWKKLSRSVIMLSDVKRIHAIADDIISHFYASNKGTPFKAILATSTQSVAVEYKKYFDSLKGTDRQINAFILISDSGSPDEYEKQYTEYDIIQKIHSPSNELELIIVCNRLLTGFDAPFINTLYLTKYMQGAALLQAISRVTRVSPGKTYGRVVDYVDVMDQLASAFRSYEQEQEQAQEKEPIISITEELLRLEKYFTELDNIKEALEAIKGKKKQRTKNKMSGVELEESYKRTLQQCEEILTLNTHDVNEPVSEEITTYKERLSLYRKQLVSIQSSLKEVSFSSAEAVDIILNERERLHHFTAHDQLMSVLIELLKGMVKKKNVDVNNNSIADCAKETVHVIKLLAIRDWQTNAKVRRDMNNKLEDALIKFNNQHAAGLNYNEIDDLLEGFIKAAELILIDSNE